MMNIEYIVMSLIIHVLNDFIKKLLKYGTHINNIRKREQLNKSFQVISLK